MDPSSQTKACPLCGEEILAVALKCKHCQSVLGGPPVPAPRASSGDAAGTVLLLAPWIGVALLWLWVGESPLIKASDNWLIVGALVVVGTAIMAAVDASTLGLGAPPTKGTGPGGTFFGVLMLWFLMYPVHMHERAKYGGRPYHTWAAVIGMIAFIASFAYLGSLINQKIEELRRAFGQY